MSINYVLRFTERDGALTFAVRVVPRSSRSAVVGEYDGGLRVRVAAPPADGAANEELIKTLATALHVPARAVEIMSGHSAKTKTVRVTGAAASLLLRLAANE